MKQKILEILSDIRPEFDFSENVDYIKNEMLDSLDVITLVDELQEEYGIEIPGSEITMENFCSLDAINNLVVKYKS